LRERLEEPSSTGALAYAAPVAPAAARPAPAPPVTARPTAQPDTTTAIKRSNAPSALPVAAAGKVGDRFNDPWMRAMIVSPSAQSFMHTTLFGMTDFRNLAPYLKKPTSSVMMTFSADPHLGMTTDEFAGSAVVFVATVTYNTRTAALR
jgi:hypothetical protein